jgi:hypothetical protein
MIIRTTGSQSEADKPRRHSRFAGLPQVFSATALALVVLGGGAQAALAYGTPLPCGSRSEAAVFAPWGDTATYFLVSNGGFESGSTDWSLSNGAKVVSGNETYHVAGAADSHSLSIPPNGAAESRTLCVSRGEDTIRLFVANPHKSGSILHVDAIVVNPDNGAIGTTAFDVNGDVPSAAWAPTLQLKIPNLLGGSGTEQLTLRFTTRGAAATWNIDDVFVDPFKSW